MKRNAANTLENIIRALMQKTGLRGALMIGTLFLTNDFNRSAGCSTTLALANTALSALHHQDIHDLATSVNMIDDRVDTNPPDWILKLGRPELGTVPSHFFSSKDACPEVFTHAFNKVVLSGLTQRHVGNAFNNILAYELYKRAECDAAFRNSPTLENRRSLHEANMRISAAYTIFVFRCLTKSKTIPSNIENFSYSDAAKHMPEVAHISAILQIFDDVRDVIIDLEGEVKNGIPSSNWLALKMSENGHYTTGNKNIDSKVTNYILAKTDDAESDTSPPDFIKAGLNKTALQVGQMISDVEKSITRTILGIMLETILNSGLKSSSHPDVLDKQQRRLAEQDALSKKYSPA